MTWCIAAATSRGRAGVILLIVVRSVVCGSQAGLLWHGPQVVIDLDFDVGAVVVGVKGWLILTPERSPSMFSHVLFPTFHKHFLEGGPLVESNVLDLRPVQHPRGFDAFAQQIV